MRADRDDWSDDERYFDRGPAARRVGPPAFGLIVVAVLGFLGNCGSVFALNAYNQSRPPAPPPANMTPDEQESYKRGQQAAPLYTMCFVGVPTIVIYGLVMAGGIAMQRLRARGLAITAAILAMLPCGPAFLGGLPVGIWALVVLFKPEMTEVFAPDDR